MPKYLADFRFNYPKAIGDQLQHQFERLEAAHLEADLIGAIPAGVGVYMLFHPTPEALVYVGKADGGLRSRLSQHLRKLTGRRIDLDHVYFKGALLEEDYLAVAPEDILIKRLTPTMIDRWNGKGFGLNDPGKERDSTKFQGDHFDVRFPALLGWTLSGLSLVQSVGAAVALVQQQLPYTFRADERLQSHKSKPRPIAARPFHVLVDSLPAREAFLHLAAALPAGWQITALPGYVIGYELERVFPSAVRYWRSSAPGKTYDGPMVELDP